MAAKRNRRAGVEDLWHKSGGSPSKLNGTGLRWRARYVDDDNREHTRRFRTKPEAVKHLEGITAAQVVGSYVDPRRGAVTFASFYREWSSRQVWVPGTVQAMNLAVNSVAFSDVAMADLRPSHLESWVKAMQDKPLAAGTIRTRFNNVRAVLRAGIRDKVLAVDPSIGVALPRRRRADAAMQIPQPNEVGALLRATEDDFRAFVGVAAFAGLRLGEAAALQVGDVDFLHREIRVQRQVQRATGGIVEIRAPKYGSERVIPVPDGLLEILAEHVRLWIGAGDPGAWLFPGEGKHPLHQNSVGYRWRAARMAAGGLGYRLHDLRHFYASGLISSGCDVVTVQRALGHSSATVTLSTYSHLWPNADDRTRTAAASMFQEASGATAYSLRTQGT